MSDEELNLEKIKKAKELGLSVQLGMVEHPLTGEYVFLEDVSLDLLNGS